MNIIYKLLDEDYVLSYFKEHILPCYQDANDILKLKIRPYKKHIWITTYHVVIDYQVLFKLKNGKNRETHIICSAHSNEDRSLAFSTLKYLWQRRLGKGIVFPRPLFYSPEFKGFFYRALQGKNLLQYILIKDKDNIADLVEKSGLMFALLHRINIRKYKPIVNEKNNSIATVVPGIKHLSQELKSRYRDNWHDKIVPHYLKYINIENEYLSTKPELSLIHGDAHTENIIKVSRQKIGLIDFVDFAISDFARDVGTFLQQLDYKLDYRFAHDLAWQKEMKQLFLANYFKHSQCILTKEVQTRIDNYYKWTALRTAAYWLLKEQNEPERAQAILDHLDKMEKKKLRAQDV
jgi:thiamine kinase-like enzyme